MDTFALKIFFLLMLPVFRTPEVWGKNNKIKIIVPHKISVIHHHHSRVADPKPKKKLVFDLHDLWQSNYIHQEEESEEEANEEGRFGQYLAEPDEEASQRGVAYFPIPTPEYSNAVRVYMRPVFLYKDSFERKHPPRYEYHTHDDFNNPEERYQENGYRARGFQHK